MIDSAGQPLDNFAGTLTVTLAERDGGSAQQEVAVKCGTEASAADGDMTSVDGEHYVECGPGWIRVFPTREGPVSASLHSGAAAFEGPIDAGFTTQEDFNGPGCGSCTGGTGTVELH